MTLTVLNPATELPIAELAQAADALAGSDLPEAVWLELSLELRLARLTALGRDEIGDELNGLGAEIEDYLEILRSRERVIDIIRTELTEIKEQFGSPRRTEISDVVGDFDDEDLIAREDMVVTVTHGGYIKRVPLSAYRAQRRGESARQARHAVGGLVAPGDELHPGDSEARRSELARTVLIDQHPVGFE